MTHTGSTALVELDGVDVTLGGERVLKDIRWSLHAGQHWSFAGPNGSGKTTLLAVIRGDIWPDRESERRYTIDGVHTTSPIRARERIVRLAPELQEAYRKNKWDLPAGKVVCTGVHQTPFLYTPLDAKEEERVENIIQRLDLAGLAKRRFLTLSQGEQRRVLIARAMAASPVALILDEFFLGLDRRSSALVADGLRAALEQGVQTLTAGHRATDELPWATHRLELLEGRICSQGKIGLAADSSPLDPVEQKKTETARYSVTSGVEPLVELAGAAVRVKGRTLLDDLHWSIGRGCHWLVRGDNGAGKTTLLRLVRGDLPPYAGKGVDRPFLGSSSDAWTRRQAIGYVCPEHQASLLDRATTVAGHLERSLDLARRSQRFPDNEREDAVVQTARGLMLDALLDVPCGRLSYGQKQRLAIGRALIRLPELLLLDEPFNGLDRESRAKLHDMLRDLAATGTTLVCSTHEPKSLPACFEYVLTVENGGIRVTS